MVGMSAKLMVAVDGSRAIIRACGRASFTCSASFKQLVTRLYDQGFRRFVLELSECTIMDSTFLGMLVRFAGRLSEGGAGDGAMTLWNPSPRIVELLNSLGMAEYFRVEQRVARRLPPCQEVVPELEGTSKVDAARLALDAHEALVEANPDNELRFKDVMAFLAEDVKRLGTE
jgi:anti-sigma B factor antagonist